MSDPTVDDQVAEYADPDQDELANRDDAIAQGLSHLDGIVGQIRFLHGGAIDLEDRCELLELIQCMKRDASDIEQQMKDAIATEMTGKTAVIDGYGVVHRSRRISRTSWKKDELRMAVLDSRIVDPETGEVKEESPVDRILHVWNLPAPRTTALRERGLDADEFCVSEPQPGWNIRVEAG